MIRWLDNLVLAAHQWVVDHVQRQPNWCAMQVIHLSSLCIVFQIVVAFSWWSLLVKPLAQLLVYAFIPAPGSPPLWMRMWVWCTFGTLAVLFGTQQTAFGAAGAVSCLCFISLLYFKSCRPPKPPVRKPKLVMQS